MTLTWTKLECTVLSRVIFSFSYAGIAQYTRTHIYIYTQYDMLDTSNLDIDTIPFTELWKAICLWPNISLYFMGKKPWFPRDFPTNPVNLAKINMKIFGTSSSEGALKKFGSLNQLLLDPHEMMKMMSRQFLQKAPKRPAREKGSFPYEILAIKIWLVWSYPILVGYTIIVISLISSLYSI